MRRGAEGAEAPKKNFGGQIRSFLTNSPIIAHYFRFVFFFGAALITDHNEVLWGSVSQTVDFISN